jgi:peptide/nickel transport system substrate-binding protein
MSPSSGSRLAHRRRRLAFACAALAIALAGCAHRPARLAPGFIQVDIETSPTSLDPRFATDAVSERLDELLFDPLVRIDSDGKAAYDLAESVERTSPTELVFHLRRGIHFSDGRKLSARDVKYSYDSVLDPAVVSPKRGGFQELKSVEAVDDYTIRMTTRGPYAPALTMAMLDVVPDGTPSRGPRTPDVPAGTGPFRIVGFERDERVVVDRNPFHAAPAADAITGIEFKVVPDPTVRALELTENICDLAENNIQPDLIPYLERQKRLSIIKWPGTAYHYIAFNFRDPALRDLRVRRAIAYAIDRKQMVDWYMRGTARLATGLLSPENWAYEPDVKTYPYDPARARELLEQAGYHAGRDGMRNLSIVYKTTPEQQRMGEMLQAMLRRVGIRLSIRSNEWGTFYSDIARGNFDLISLQWVGIRDPYHYYMVFDSHMTPQHAGLNRGDYSNPEMDRLVEAANVALDPNERRKLYAQVQKLAADDLPYVSLWWQDNVVVMSRSLQGFHPYPNGSLLSLDSLMLVPPGGPESAR